jgi:hypothetical protein
MFSSIEIPAVPDHLLDRPHLVKRLFEHVGRKLTLVVAPSGFGKTTLLAQFSHAAPFPVCWLSFEETDANLDVFVYRLVSSIRRCFPAFGKLSYQALAARSDAVRDPQTLAYAIVQDIEHSVKEFCVVILDDYQTVKDAHEAGSLENAIITSGAKVSDGARDVFDAAFQTTEQGIKVIKDFANGAPAEAKRPEFWAQVGAGVRAVVEFGKDALTTAGNSVMPMIIVPDSIFKPYFMNSEPTDI